MELATIMPINSIAKLIGEHDTRIWRVVTHCVEKAREKENYSEVKSIGIDETFSKRGHNYITVFVDLEESKVIYATRFIHNHWYGIMRYIQSRINNGLLEGINSLIQATKRKARGYRNIKNLITIVYLTCGKLSFKLPKAFA